jgi:hypothetical protein
MDQSDPSVDRSIKIIRQLEQVFQPYGKMYKELGGGRGGSNCPSQCFCKEKKIVRSSKKFFGWAVDYSQNLAFRAGASNLIPAKCDVEYKL